MKFTRKTFLKGLGLGVAGTFTGTSYAKLPGLFGEKEETAIPKRKLGKNDLMVSVLCLGMGSRFTGESHLPAGEREEYLRYAMSKGVNYLDTARNYGPSEEILGNLLTDRDRDQLVISSKTPARTHDDIMKDFETSTKNLRQDYLDVFLLHNNSLSDGVEENAEGFTTLLKLRESGLVKNIGFSSHGAVSLSNAVKLVEEFDLDHLVLNVGEGRLDYRPAIPDILAKDCTVSAIKVTRSWEGKGPVERAKLAYKDVLDRSFTAGIISHSNIGTGERGWKTLLDENLKTARSFA